MTDVSKVVQWLRDGDDVSISSNIVLFMRNGQLMIRDVRQYEPDTIDIAAAALAAVLSSLSWIPVTERLPEHGQVVQVVFRDRGKIYHGHGAWSRNWAVLQFHDGRPMNVGGDFKVTHWQPLPELPEVE